MGIATYHLYSIPFLPVLEEGICIFPKIFSTDDELLHRSGEKIPGPAQKIRKFKQNRQNQLSQSGKIQPSSQHGGRPVEDPDLAVVPQQGEKEEPGSRRQPEGQVQQKGQPAEGEEPAHCPHGIVEQSHAHPQQQSLGEDKGLRQVVLRHAASPEQPGEEAAPLGRILLVGH